MCLGVLHLIYNAAGSTEWKVVWQGGNKLVSLSFLYDHSQDSEIDFLPVGLKHEAPDQKQTLCVCLLNLSGIFLCNSSTCTNIFRMIQPI